MLWNVEPRRGHGDLCRCRGVGFFYVLWLPTQHYLLVVVAATYIMDDLGFFSCVSNPKKRKQPTPNDPGKAWKRVRQDFEEQEAPPPATTRHVVLPLVHPACLSGCHMISKLVSPTADSVSDYGKKKGNEMSAEYFSIVLEADADEQLTIVAGDTGETIATIRGGGVKSFNTDNRYYIDTARTYEDLKNMDQVIQGNAADERSPTRPGRGDVRHMGVRYDYANQDASKQKLVSCKRHKDCSKRRHKGAINVVQRVTNSGVIVAKGWMCSRLQQQVQHLDTICPTTGTGSLCFPIASVSNNGGFGIHKDGRDLIEGMWIVFGEAGMVFPAYDLYVKLHDGDVMTFDSQVYHAGVAYPMCMVPPAHCRVIVSAYFQSQQEAYLRNHVAKCDAQGLAYAADSD